MFSPSLNSYKSKRPNLGEMAEAPDLKKVHGLTGQSVPAEWAHWRPKPTSMTTEASYSSSGNTVEQEVYAEHSEPSASEAAALQGREGRVLDEICLN